jgi:molybdate transport system substrate-binding protein
VVLAATGCGGWAGDADRGEGRGPELRVAAAASLSEPFARYGRHFRPGRPRLSFAGSDELAAQIERGARPDVYAAADTELPDRLHAKGLAGRPVRFASNRLVVAVPAESPRAVRSIADLAQPGTRVALGSEGVPIGLYTRRVLARLPPSEEGRILANVRSNEPDVKGVIAKVAQGAVDAGIVYASDVTASAGQARAIAVPERLQPNVVYAAVAVKGARHRVETRAFVEGLRGPEARRALRAAGFGPPPR